MNNIMIQGTASSVGKSIITAGLCRVFLQDGYSVAPFKSQNMALNSFVTEDGHEMGRAQVVQAQASNLKPSVLMNPILLKPSSDRRSQVVLNGEVYKNLTFSEYNDFKKEARNLVKDAYSKLEELYDVIVIEGAGSPAEINLRENDIVNMGMAEISDAPVILVGDIDRGGVFASIAGTISLLTVDEKNRIKGVIINKFRGDIDILIPGIKMLEDIINIPVLGIIPHMEINLDDEDSLTDKFRTNSSGSDLKITVIKLPHISNFTDFDPFRMHDDVELSFAQSADDINDPDILIIPGTKNTIKDLEFIRGKKIDEKIYRQINEGRLLAGICGGYQMMGKKINDPHMLEGDTAESDGLGLVDMVTTIKKEKIKKQVKGKLTSAKGLLEGIDGIEISGYEIHMGLSEGELDDCCFIRTETGNSGILIQNLLGTYIHGIFDNHEFTNGLLNNIRKVRGLPEKKICDMNIINRDNEFNMLADVIRERIDMNKLYKILNGERIACS